MDILLEGTSILTSHHTLKIESIHITDLNINASKIIKLVEKKEKRLCELGVGKALENTNAKILKRESVNRISLTCKTSVF